MKHEVFPHYLRHVLWVWLLLVFLIWLRHHFFNPLDNPAHNTLTVKNGIINNAGMNTSFRRCTLEGAVGSTKSSGSSEKSLVAKCESDVWFCMNMSPQNKHKIRNSAKMQTSPIALPIMDIGLRRKDCHHAVTKS